MAPVSDGLDYGSWTAVKNAPWLRLANVRKKYQAVLAITCLVTFIATYHYSGIFNSWNEAFDEKFSANVVSPPMSGLPSDSLRSTRSWDVVGPPLSGLSCSLRSTRSWDAVGPPLSGLSCSLRSTRSWDAVGSPLSGLLRWAEWTLIWLKYNELVLPPGRTYVTYGYFDKLEGYSILALLSSDAGTKFIANHMQGLTDALWPQLANVSKNYRTALAITRLGTFIATYHYSGIFNSWKDAFDVKFSANEGNYVVNLTDATFNDSVAPTAIPTSVPSNLPTVVPNRSAHKVSHGPKVTSTATPTAILTATPTLGTLTADAPLYHFQFPLTVAPTVSTSTPSNLPTVVPNRFAHRVSHGPMVTPTATLIAMPTAAQTSGTLTTDAPLYHLQFPLTVAPTAESISAPTGMPTEVWLKHNELVPPPGCKYVNYGYLGNLEVYNTQAFSPLDNMNLTDAPFIDAYRHVDWVLMAPPLLIELIFVMRLQAEETVNDVGTKFIANHMQGAAETVVLTAEQTPWNDAFDVKFSAIEGNYVVNLTGVPFIDAYRHVDWALMVPLFLIELIFVMRLPAEETVGYDLNLIDMTKRL